jgi:hypothetical protein
LKKVIDARQAFVYALFVDSKTYYFHWSASEIMGVQFVRWQRKRWPRRHDGTRKPGWWGVGAVVSSKWAWRYPEAKRIARRQGLPEGHVWLAPHTELYLSRRGAETRRGKTLKRPTLEEYARLCPAQQRATSPRLRLELCQRTSAERLALLREWQAHAERMGKILGCVAITDDIEHAARKLKKVQQAMSDRLRLILKHAQ